MTIDNSICENCLAKNHCDVLPYSNNCNEVRAIAEHDRVVYNKAIDDFAEKMKYEYGSDEIHETIDEIAEQLKAGGENG